MLSRKKREISPCRCGVGYAHRMSFWIHNPLTWLAHLLMTVGGLCVRVCVGFRSAQSPALSRGLPRSGRTCRNVRPCCGSSRISRGAAFREPVLVCPEALEGAGGAARVVTGASPAPGRPQPWRRAAQDASPRPAAVPSAVVGRGPACEAVHELWCGAAGDLWLREAVSVSLSPSFATSHPSSPRRRGSIRWARAAWWVGRDGRGRLTRRSRLSTSREVARWIPACAGMTREVGGARRA